MLHIYADMNPFKFRRILCRLFSPAARLEAKSCLYENLLHIMIALPLIILISAALLRGFVHSKSGARCQTDPGIKPWKGS